ncbi:serine protease [Amycolatopsis azurea]|uniref:NACHT domain-containing protein n=1 Tax=Amycolatopsis azurea DSM 43854 TaxID=1238180 RepID=M2PY67_9PSEU|nr:serine protease [Amycolatopsis azurea]EMD24620.1 hypothetical protein C791_5640 [Amycolatopsis azurea DSM 43854]OOC02094.1 hypothetical protein B0293_34510 [Amycolatopsis azurea DSM 43854]
MSGQRAALTAAAQASTVPLTTPSGKAKGTGFHITSTLVLTCAHVVLEGDGPAEFMDGPDGRFEVLTDWFLPGGAGGLDLALLRASTPTAPAYLAEAVEPGDELWVFGYPEGNYRAGDSVTIRYEGTSEHVAGPVLLKGAQGRIRPGMSGGPVLNWRTGAICGVVRYRDGTHDDIARFVPMSTIFHAYPGSAEANLAEAPPWLRLLDDEQIAAAGVCFPGPLMRRYLTAASTADDIHPYAAMLDVRAPLSKVYLRQQASRGEAADETAETTERLDGTDLLRRYEGAQVLGGPGAGKSSLARHLAALSARQWLNGAGGGGVPILVTADALTRNESLVEMLANGVVQTIDIDLDRAALKEMFAKPPFPGASWLVLVDGVDEILYPYLREIVLSKITRHRTEGRYRFLLTTRPLPTFLLNKVADGDRYPTFTIEPFGRHELKAFAGKWFEQLGLPDPSAADDFDRRLTQAGIGHLATIPLIATMLCILYADAPEQRLPGNRAELYADFVELLLTKRRITNVREMLRSWTSRSGPRAVAATEELVQRTPELLKLIAHHQHQAAVDPFLAGKSPDAVAVVTGVIGKPGELSSAEWASVIREVLRSCGLLVERRGEFRFLHQTVQEYLAAAYLADHHPDPRKQAARRRLVPKPWPRQDLEVMTFLVALWAKNGRDVGPVLNRLLSRKNRRENHRFILELHRQGVRLPERTTARLTDFLVHSIRDHGLSNDEWRTAAASLVEVDLERAMRLFEEAAGPGYSWQRRYDSGVLLLGHRPHLGTRALATLAEDRAIGGAERLNAAKKLHEHDPTLSLAALESIARSVMPDNLRVEAARLVLEHDPRNGLRLLREIAYSARAEAPTRLSAALELGRHDSGEALLMLSGLREFDGDRRFEAALEAARWAPESTRAVLIEISESPKVETSARFRAADHLARQGDEAGFSGFEAIARTESADTATRVRAAARAAEIDHVAGTALHLDLIADETMDDDRITVGLAAGLVDPAAAASALARLVGGADGLVESFGFRIESDSADFWARAGLAAAKLDRETGVKALKELALDTEYSASTRAEAAAAVAEVDYDAGVALLEELAGDYFEDAEMRIESAAALYDVDFDHGRNAARALMRSSSLGPGRVVTLGSKIGRNDKELGLEILRGVALSSAHGPTWRLDAANAAISLDRTYGGEISSQVRADHAVREYLESEERSRKWPR